jgi:hypothetical protein
MNYTKPAITLMGAAKSAIQNIPKSASPVDSNPEKLVATSNAYEADE